MSGTSSLRSAAHKQEENPKRKRGEWATIYFFLAISLQKDVISGMFWPAYVLCKTYTTSEKRSGYKIVKIEDGVQLKTNPRLLFTETLGHEDMINFMSSYQCQDKKGKHYHPKGYLCWYGCNQYGEMNGFVQPIKRVPEYVWIFDFKNKGFQRLKREQSIIPRLNEVISREPRGSPFETANVKPILSQESKRQRRKKNASSKKGRNK